jgi:hypothetical protein
MLNKLKSILIENQQIPLKELSELLDLDREATKQLLSFYIQKNLVEKLPEGTLCTHCSVCEPQTIEIYRWLGDSIPLTFNSN